MRARPVKPMVWSVLALLLGACATTRASRERGNWRTLGTSVEGRPLRVAQFGHGPRRVLLVGGIHGDEREGRLVAQELPGALLATPGAAARVTLTVLEDANPDGTARGVRHNARRVDLNRNYPAANFTPAADRGRRPLDQPEARLLHDLILRERPELVIVVHSWRGDHFINFDGPGAAIAAAFARRSGYRVKASDDIAPTPGSLGSWVGGTLGVPILTLEFQRGREAWAAWFETKAALLGAVVGD
ncbi:MAG: succinylglutamate desuccinylase/aspartoacylase family protein [Planctomycetes bacterium]|nr:succinylglutamate desuccinylase/aspartoacylase family protein [Planctomycetota bacterium]